MKEMQSCSISLSSNYVWSGFLSDLLGPHPAHILPAKAICAGVGSGSGTKTS